MQFPWHLLKTVVCRPSKPYRGRSRQVNEGNSRLGIDCSDQGEMVNASSLIHDSVTDGLAYCLDMKKQFVYDPLISKRQQYLLATQVSLIGSIELCLELTLSCTARARGAENR